LTAENAKVAEKDKNKNKMDSCLRRNDSIRNVRILGELSGKELGD
jgi:hypothetical protein